MKWINVFLFLIYILFAGQVPQETELPKEIKLNSMVSYKPGLDSWRMEKGFVKLPRIERDSLVSDAEMRLKIIELNYK